MRAPTLPTLILATALLGSLAPRGAAQAARAPDGVPAVSVPGGAFVPMYLQPGAQGAVRVTPFRLDAVPVSRARFAAFVAAEPRWRRDRAAAALAGRDYLAGWPLPERPDEATADRPVTQVSWFAARAFCAWAGGRLPTTDEWEYAAGFDPDGRRAGGTSAHRAAVLRWYHGRPGPRALPAVGTTDRNGLGLHDLHGLVWEWTADFNNQMVTGAGRDDRGLDRQLFCAAASAGATDPTDYAAFLRYSFRATLDGGHGGEGLGFRCAY